MSDSYVGKSRIIRNNPYAIGIYNVQNVGNSVVPPPTPGACYFLQLENLDYILLENNSKLELEGTCAGGSGFLLLEDLDNIQLEDLSNILLE